MLKKISSKNIYALVDPKKNMYSSFERKNTYYNKKDDCIKPNVPKYIILNGNNKEIFTGVPINFDKHEGIFANKKNLEDVSKKEVLLYIKLILEKNKFISFISKLNSFYNNSITEESLERIRK